MMTNDDKTRIKWLIWMVCVVAALSIFVHHANGKDLPEIVSSSQLSSTWDGKRVAIFDYARSCEPMRGRMGSNYMKCIVGSDLEKVTVYTSFPVYGVVGERVIVQGIYRKHGRFGGLLADHFIAADALIRDWGK